MNPDYDAARIDLRTPIRIQVKITGRAPGELDPVDRWVDVEAVKGAAVLPGELPIIIEQKPAYKRCQWSNAHGSEAIRQDMAVGKERATLVIRYDSRVNNRCRVLRGDDAWEILSVDDVRAGHRYMELIVEREVSA